MTASRSGVREPFGALPLGELHAAGVCYRCGRKGPEYVRGARDDRGDLSKALRLTVNRSTLARAHVCIATAACERRRYRRKR